MHMGFSIIYRQTSVTLCEWMGFVAHLFTGLHFLKRHVSSLNIFIWAIALCGHAACRSFAGLLAVRLILGICEGSITAGFLIVSSMFYTRREYTTRVGYWCKDCDQPPLTPFLIL
jgi:MFS family permease